MGAGRRRLAPLPFERNTMSKIKITEPGWEGYTGNLGTLIFEGGVSVREPTQRERDVFSVTIRIADVDDDGNETTYSANDFLRTASHLAMEPQPEKLTVVPVVEAPAKVVTVTPPLPIDAPSTPAKIYELAELEAIADKDGIKGLRAIGTPLGVKNTSIPKLIDEILAAQAKLAAK